MHCFKTFFGYRLHHSRVRFCQSQGSFGRLSHSKSQNAFVEFNDAPIRAIAGNKRLMIQRHGFCFTAMPQDPRFIGGGFSLSF